MTQASGKRRQRGLAGTGLAVLGLLVAGAAFAVGLNDTGQTTCYDSIFNPVFPEPSTHPRQDCTIGRDAAAAAGVLPKTGAGSKGFDYTKIASDGSALPASATSWSCVLDNLTGLTWEVKTDDGGLRDWDWAYTWYDDIHTDNNGGNPGYKGSDTCGGTLPNNECNTQAYVAAVNAVDLCGSSDWRLPTLEELRGLVDYGIGGSLPSLLAKIDAAYFPNTRQFSQQPQQEPKYWSSTTSAFAANSAWLINFNTGTDNTGMKTPEAHEAHYLRLVRGGQ